MSTPVTSIQVQDCQQYRNQVALLRARFEACMRAKSIDPHTVSGEYQDNAHAVLEEIIRLCPQDAFVEIARHRLGQHFVKLSLAARAAGDVESADGWQQQASVYLEEHILCELSQATHDVPANDDTLGAKPARDIHNIHGLDSVDVQQLQQRAANDLQQTVFFRDSFPGLKAPRLMPEMAVIPAGSFMMGSPENEEGRSECEGPLHPVSFFQHFAMGRYTVTFEQFDYFCDETGHAKPKHYMQGRGAVPVINLRVADAQAYCQWLSDKSGFHYRLPTESEWEYACRAGSVGPFSFAPPLQQEKMNYNGYFRYGGGRKSRSRNNTVPVGSLPANAWGLHEMHGNVQEFVQDVWKPGYRRLPSDGSVAMTNGNPDVRIVRGGSWFDQPAMCRSAARKTRILDELDVNLGFRLVREME